MDPRIAVIIPCFNDGPLLVEAVASVDEGEPIELVIVDDGSIEPTTLEILAGLEAEDVRVVRHATNRGLVHARTTGLRTTVAPYVFPLDADDMAERGALTRMADRLDELANAAVCYGDYLEFGAHELVRAVPPHIDPYRLAYTNEYPVSALFRRALLEEVGGWTAPARGYEDWNLWMTIAEKRIAGVHLGPGELTFRKRFHGERMLSRSKREHQALYGELRSLHPRLFSELRLHRRRSDLPRRRKVLYPFVYGGRRRFALERRAKRLLDRSRIWTLQR